VSFPDKPDLLTEKRERLAAAMAKAFGPAYLPEWHVINLLPEAVLDQLLDHYDLPIHVG